MLDIWLRRARYSLGNGMRTATRPWRQWTIAPDEATTIFACVFGATGWHHVRSTLSEMDAVPDISPKATTLWRYLKNFKPTSISELVGVHGGALPLFVYPWGTFGRGILETDK